MATSTFQLQILHLYGESGVLADQTAPNAAALVDKFKTQYANTLTVAEGDTWIPGPWLVGGADPSLNSAPGVGATALARPDVAIMNAIGVNVSALGNHEFDLGSAVVQGAIQNSGAWVGAQFPFVTANLDFSADSSLKPLADKTIGGAAANSFAGAEASTIKGKITPSAVVTINGQKVGVVGVTTYDLLSKSSPSGTVVKDDGNVATDKLHEAAALLQTQIDALTAAGVDKIVMVDQLDTLDRDKAIAPLLHGVDVIVAGGGHERLGDGNDTPGAFNGHTPDFITTDSYPIQTAGSDGAPTLIVTTDTEFSYVGRLVVDFDASGHVIPAMLDSTVDGAYASNAATVEHVYNNGQTAAQIIAGSTSASNVKAIADAVNNVIVAKDSVVYGYTNVFLEGDRVFGRAQEVNLGDITADANAFKARAALAVPAGTAIVSLKNGGGIRASIGVIDDDTFEKVKPLATANHPAGAITQLDVENALRFNNQLMVFDTNARGLLNILNYGTGLAAGNGGYPQIGGVRVSFDPTRPAGSQVQNIALVDASGNVTAEIVKNGVVQPGAPTEIPVVILNFTANGGDGYPIKANGTNFRYLKTDGTLSAPVNPALDFTAAGTFASVGITGADILGEQKAFADYLQTNYATPGTAYGLADTPQSGDLRIENLSKRADAVFSGPHVSDATQGPSSSQNAYLKPLVSSVSFQSVVTTGDAVGIKDDGYTPWKFAGVPDGIGAFDNGDGTVTVLVNHELTPAQGIVRDHGSAGAFVSSLRVDKTTLAVLDGKDLIEDIHLWDPVNKVYVDGTTALTRLCSADLPPASAFYNSSTGLGFNEGRIFMDGEESGVEGRAFAHFASGPQAGNSFELPALGKFAHENVVANGYTGNRTVVAGMDDGQNGQVYFYVGDKKADGSAIDKAGLTGGHLFGIRVSDLTANSDNEPNTALPLGADETSAFTMVDLGDVTNMTGAQLDAASETAGVTSFLRPEDGAWDTINHNRFYFVTTDAFNAPSRLWAADFTDASRPELGGTIRLLLNGTEGQQMMDNITVNAQGHVIIQEDVGNNAFVGRVLDYNPQTDTLTPIAQHDPARFAPGGANFITQDEESSGVIDVTDLLGSPTQNVYLLDVQAHNTIPGELAEGGQLLVMRQDPFAGDDALIGTNANDTFYGGAGNDYINTGAGVNVAYGGAGNDTMFGGSGTDLLYGDAGDDAILAGSGATFASGGAGNDSIYGGASGDYLMGDAGDDLIVAQGSQNNILNGGAGNDDIRGAGGMDALFAGTGRDYLTGGAGTDYFYVFDGGLVANDQKFIMDFNAGGMPDYVVLPASTKGSALFFDQGGFAWIAAPTAGGFDYVAVMGASASTVASQTLYV